VCMMALKGVFGSSGYDGSPYIMALGMVGLSGVYNISRSHTKHIQTIDYA
jgi:hypothetical protein